MIIARATPNQMIGVGVGIGFRLPALHSSLGRMLLASLDDAELDNLLETAQPRAATPRTVTDKRELRTAVHAARRDGFAYVDREVLSVFRSVAVPLHRWDGQPVAAMNIGASSDRVDEQTMLGPLLDALRAAADELSGVLV
ncbi:MAG: hypothetical protein LC635_04140 [Pseudonocardiaceae bacterium]|nr:hypothetical protein [Pseudonocardiaceae bacterium]